MHFIGIGIGYVSWPQFHGSFGPQGLSSLRLPKNLEFVVVAIQRILAAKPQESSVIGTLLLAECACCAVAL